MQFSQNSTTKNRPLQALGIDAAEERAYRWLLGHNGTTVSEAAKALGIPARTVRRIFNGLERMGLLSYSPQRPRRYIAAAPDIGLEGLFLRRQEELQNARSMAQELQELAFQNEHEHAPLVELLTNAEAQRHAFEQLHHSVTSEVVTLVRPPILISRLDAPTDDDERSQRNAQARGVRYRSIVDSAYLALPGALERTRVELRSGEEIRLVPELPLKMVVADRRFAFIPLALNQDQGPSLLVRSSALVDALLTLFETLWDRATPVALTDGELQTGIAAEAQADEHEELLALMAAGLNDKKILDQLGVSASTMHRRLRELMAAADVRTRFQLGWVCGLRWAKQNAHPTRAENADQRHAATGKPRHSARR